MRPNAPLDAFNNIGQQAAAPRYTGVLEYRCAATSLRRRKRSGEQPGLRGARGAAERHGMGKQGLPFRFVRASHFAGAKALARQHASMWARHRVVAEHSHAP